MLSQLNVVFLQFTAFVHILPFFGREVVFSQRLRGLRGIAGEISEDLQTVFVSFYLLKMGSVGGFVPGYQRIQSSYLLLIAF